MFDLIVVPTDGSEHAAAAADDATALAATHDADLHVLSVADPGPFGGVRLPGADRSAESAFRERAETVVERVAERAAASGIDPTTAVAVGPPPDEILDYADAVGADLLVMGSRGRGGLERVALGSVTDRVIRLGEVRVLVVDAETGVDPETEMDGNGE